MDLDDYQRHAIKTRRPAENADSSLIITLLGLAGETGELLSEYKKKMRDGDAHLLHDERVAEELGDLLWYIANVADLFELELGAVAAQNLRKVDARWGAGRVLSQSAGAPSAFDQSFPLDQQLPRRGIAEIVTLSTSPLRIATSINGTKMGQDLTDNAHVEDGYRFHDVFHVACMTLLGWSPVVRRGLTLKRKLDPKIDEVEDGGRAIVIEEGISALVFSYAVPHDMLNGVTALDYDLLRTIKQMTAFLEVSCRTEADWESTILKAYEVWRVIARQGAGRIAFNADAGNFLLLQGN